MARRRKTEAFPLKIVVHGLQGIRRDDDVGVDEYDDVPRRLFDAQVACAPRAHIAGVRR